MPGPQYGLDFYYQFPDEPAPLLHLQYKSGLVTGPTLIAATFAASEFTNFFAALDVYIAAIELADAPELARPIEVPHNTELKESEEKVEVTLSIDSLDWEVEFEKGGGMATIAASAGFEINWLSFIYFVKIMKIAYKLMQELYADPW